MKIFLTICLYLLYIIVPVIGIKHSLKYHNKQIFDGIPILVNPPWIIFRFGESFFHNFINEEENNEILQANCTNLWDLFVSIQDSTTSDVYRIKDAKKIRNEISKLPENMVIKFDSFSTEIYNFDSVRFNEEIKFFSSLMYNNELNKNDIINHSNKITKQLETINKKYNINLKVFESDVANYTNKLNLLLELNSIGESKGFSREEYWLILLTNIEKTTNSIFYEKRKILELIKDR
jgi:hypothetical protein